MRIGLLGHNFTEYIELLFDIWNNNDSAVLIDYDTPASVVQKILEEYGAQYCFVEETHGFQADIYESDKIRTYTVKSKMPCLLSDDIRNKYKARYDETEAVVINSSGTTGNCKGISLSHRSISNNADSVIDYMKPTKKDCLYLNKKLTHCSSLIGELLVSLKSGANILVSPLIIPPRVAFKNIKDYNVSILCCNPTLLRMYVDEAERTKLFPDTARVVYTSGDIISAKDIERARTVFKCPVYNVYGQTECGPRITAQTGNCCHVNSVGKPIKNVEIRIDENKEILVKTNALFSGYTNSTIIPEEWHRTGDLGYIDENGELYVIGRTDNMVVIGAHNVYPEAVEKVIAENTDVEDCIVFIEDGKLVCEYVGQTETGLTITKNIKPLLMPYEIPKFYRKVDTIPKNRNGKKLRSRK